MAISATLIGKLGGGGGLVKPFGPTAQLESGSFSDVVTHVVTNFTVPAGQTWAVVAHVVSSTIASNNTSNGPHPILGGVNGNRMGDSDDYPTASIYSVFTAGTYNLEIRTFTNSATYRSSYTGYILGVPL